MKYVSVKKSKTGFITFARELDAASRSEGGFTLIELTVVIFGFSLIVVGLIALVSFIFGFSGRQGGLLASSDQARRLSFSIINELRNTESSSIGSYSLDTANEQELIFYSNIDDDLEIERIRYFLQEGKLYKGVLKPSGDPLAYNLNEENTFVVQDNVANGSSPLFYYYDGSYDGTSDNYLIQPVNVTHAKFIKINLGITNTGGTTNENFYTVTSSGAIRNLKTNLGD